jgi:hypothetical protein
VPEYAPINFAPRLGFCPKARDATPMNGFTTPYDGSRLSAGDFELPLGPPVAPLARRGATRTFPFPLQPAFTAAIYDGVGEVFDWYFSSGDVEFHTGGSDPMT